MDLTRKAKQLQEIYRSFERESASFREQAVCGPGCAYCCTHFGHLDITTLEGWIIQERIKQLHETEKRRIEQKIRDNKRDKEAGKPSVCPFLLEDQTCLMYDVRPFSCRQLYSLKKCGEHGPVVHPQAIELARDTVRLIQQLDATGYSGHLSFILALLDQKRFFNLYTSGGFEPARVADFGKAHGLIINASRIQPP
jgi:Fe-S-cluster containining protein